MNPSKHFCQKVATAEFYREVNAQNPDCELNAFRNSVRRKRKVVKDLRQRFLLWRESRKLAS